QIRQSGIYTIGLLSALAPRMAYLETELENVGGTVRFGLDPVAGLADWTAAAEPAGPVDVTAWKSATRAQRDFWPTEEGGTGTAEQLRNRFQDLVPQGVLPQQLTRMSGDIPGRLQAFMRRQFADPFINAQSPRDLVLRGRYDDAAGSLVQTRDELGNQKK